MVISKLGAESLTRCLASFSSLGLLSRDSLQFLARGPSTGWLTTRQLASYKLEGESEEQKAWMGGKSQYFID